MREIDDRYVDVDFTDEMLRLGFLAGANEPALFGFEAYEDAVPLLTWAEIDEEIERIEADASGAEHLVTRIYNQGREGSCVGNGFAQSHEIKQALQFGRDRVIALSAISLYKRIGRTAQSGATVSDGIKEMSLDGVLPLDTPENRQLFGNAVMPATGFGTRFPADWKQTARRFAAREWHVAKSTQGIFTALCNRDPVIVGREGHCVCSTTPIRHQGQRATQYVNSWGNWGFGDGTMPYGFGVDTMRQIEASANWAVVLRSVADPGVL